MKVSQSVVLPEGVVQFEGELSQKEADLVVEIGLNYLIRAGAFPAVTAALQEAQKEEEAAMGYSDDTSSYAFPEDMKLDD